MMFDEQHGWVERGTRGVHSGAVVRDVGSEIALLDKLSRESYHDGYWWPGLPRAQRMQQLEQSMLYHAEVCDNLLPMRRQAWPLHISRDASAGYITHKLATLAPYIAILRAGDEKRRRRVYAGFDVGQGSTTVMTTYAVEGDTLRIVHNVQFSARAQTVNVTMTIGGE